jgi:hypothetical protein
MVSCVLASSPTVLRSGPPQRFHVSVCVRFDELCRDLGQIQRCAQEPRDDLAGGHHNGAPIDVDELRSTRNAEQRDHLHLLVEADDKAALAQGLRALAIRVALTVNAASAGKGRVFEGRYHARALRTPREVRFGLLYVLMNHKKHLRRAVRTLIDRCSSGIWFRGWRETPPLRANNALAGPKTWLLRSGWLEHGGKLSVHAAPRPP